MLTKETCADEAVNTMDFIPSSGQNTFNQMISGEKRGIKGFKKIKAVIYYLQPNHWFDKLLDDFEVDLIEFKHVDNDSR